MKQHHKIEFAKEYSILVSTTALVYLVHVIYALVHFNMRAALIVFLTSFAATAAMVVAILVFNSHELSKRLYIVTTVLSCFVIASQVDSVGIVFMIFMGIIYEVSIFMDTRVIFQGFIFSEICMGVYLFFFYEWETSVFPVSYMIIEEAVYVVFFILLMRSTKQRSEYVFSYEIKALQAEEANMSKNIFLANMSHEIRTPLNAIKGMGELMSERELSPIEREYVRNIQKSSDELLAIVNNLLDFANIESGRMEFHSDCYDMGSMIHDLCTEVNRKIETKPISFILEIDPEFPHLLKGDPGRVRQVLENVLDNAVKFTASGSVYMGVRCEVKNDMAHIYIDITDTGIGIKDADLKKIFDAFSQADMHHHRRAEGTGLGLSIVKRLVNSMDGDVHIVSRENEGTTVKLSFYQQVENNEPFVTIDTNAETKVFIYEPNRTYSDNLVKTLTTLGVKPVRLQSLDYVRDDLSTAEGGIVLFDDLRGAEFFESIKDEFKKFTFISMFTAATRINRPDVPGIVYAERPITILSLAGFLNRRFEAVAYEAKDNVFEAFSAPDASVMVVDDNETNLRVAEGFLLKYGVKITSVLSGYECIKELSNADYDIVFMDHMMPNLDGVETTQLIRKNEVETGKHQIIVALTANAVQGAEDMLLSCGMDGFLSKPIDSLRLNQIMKKYIPDEKKREKLEEEPKADAKAVLSTENIDTAKGVETLGGDRDNYISIMRTAYSEAKKQIRTIRTSFDSGDIKTYIITVHAVKSTMLGLGATQLSEMAKSHEFAGKEGNVAFIKNDIDNLLSHFEVVMDEMKSILDSEKKENEGDDGILDITKYSTFGGNVQEESEAEVSNVDIGELVSDAVDALDAFDSERATELLKKAIACNPASRDKLEDALSSVDILEYDDAIAILKELL